MREGELTSSWVRKRVGQGVHLVMGGGVQLGLGALYFDWPKVMIRCCHLLSCRDCASSAGADEAGGAAEEARTATAYSLRCPCCWCCSLQPHGPPAGPTAIFVWRHETGGETERQAKGMVDVWLLGNASTCEGIFLLSSFLPPRLAVVLLVESSNRTQRPLPLPQGIRTLMHLEPHRLCLAIWGFVLPPLWQATFHPSSPLLSWDRYVCSLED